MSTNDLLSAVQAFERAVEMQHHILQGKIQNERVRRPMNLLKPLYCDTLNKVSSHAINQTLQRDEVVGWLVHMLGRDARGDWQGVQRFNAYYPVGKEGKKEIPSTCSGVLWKSIGLPCVHTIIRKAEL